MIGQPVNIIPPFFCIIWQNFTQNADLVKALAHWKERMTQKPNWKFIVLLPNVMLVRHLGHFTRSNDFDTQVQSSWSAVHSRTVEIFRKSYLTSYGQNDANSIMNLNWAITPLWLLSFNSFDFLVAIKGEIAHCTQKTWWHVMSYSNGLIQLLD